MRRWWLPILAFLFFAPALPLTQGCEETTTEGDDSADDSDDSDDADDSDGAVGADDTDDDDAQPTLTDADFPDVSPCSDRDTLPTDATFVDTIENASAILHIHKMYESDADLGAICGKDGEWDPSEISEDLNTEVRSENTFANLDEFIGDQFDEADGINMTEICRSDFGFETMDTEAGFPEAGTYRGEGCVAQGASAYRLRVRATVSGDSADEPFVDVGLTEGEITINDDAGNSITNLTDAKVYINNELSSDGEVSFTVKSGGGATEHLSVLLEVICVKSVDACPDPT